MAEVGDKVFHDCLWHANSCPKLLKGSCTQQISPDAIEDNRSAESLLLNRCGLRDPAECSAQDFTDTLKLIFRRWKRFKDVNRMAAVGMADIIFEEHLRFHPRHNGSDKKRTCSRSGATLTDWFGSSCHAVQMQNLRFHDELASKYKHFGSCLAPSLILS